MRQNIQIKVLSSGSTNALTNYVTNLDIPKDSKISEVKGLCKSNIPGSNSFEVVDEIIWFGSKKTNDNDIFMFKSGYEYNLFVK